MSDSIPDLQRLRKGDNDVWTQAFETLWRFAYRAALNPLAALTPDEAEDVAVDALAQLVPRIATVTSWDHVKALVVTIAQRQAVSAARRNSALKRPRIEVNLEAMPDGGEQLLNRNLQDDPAQEIHAAELLALLHRTLNALEEPTRRLIVGRFLEGLEIKELSQKYQESKGNVALRIFRGLRRIREELKKSADLLKEFEAFLR